MPAIGWRQATQHVADVGDEAEIEHAIGFVEYDGLCFAQFEDVLLEVIDDASRRADQDIDTALEVTALLLVIHATINHGDAQPRVLTELYRVLVNLDGELACRRDDQCADRSRAASGRGGVFQ